MAPTHEIQLATPDTARRPGLLARTLFSTMDVVYGRAPTLEKFAALELVARVPYQAWENVAYVALTHLQGRAGFTRRVFEFVVEARDAQDNEQWHLLLVEELIAQRGLRRSWLRARAIPQLLAVVYYHISWLLYVIAPRLSYALNADFEDHAEHTYLAYLQTHPELEREPWRTEIGSDYAELPTVGALLRRIAQDEGEHRDHSLRHLSRPRFSERLSLA
jgi:demethoxyubiquinone hydroxylase (CLK1/Coq7/Cat5 family)